MKKEHQFINGVEQKECSRCKAWLPLERFHKDSSKWDGLHGFCKMCTKRINHNTYEKNPSKRYEWTLNNNRRYGIVGFYNPAYYKTPSAMEKNRLTSRKRHKLMKAANETHPLTTELRNKVYEKYAYKCAYCGADCSKKHHIDHKLPISRGGGNDFDNLALACPSCNAKKGVKTDVEFVGHIV